MALRVDAQYEDREQVKMRTPQSIVLIAVAAAGLQSMASADTDVPVLAPGLYTRTLERDGKPTLGYTIVVPPGYTRATPVPLVLALHFGVQGGPSLNVGRDLVRALVGPAFGDLGAVVVAPDVLGGGPWSTPANDEAVLALLDSVARAYNVDARRVVVTGYSMGGTGAWHFAGKYPDRFAALVPVAGRPPAASSGWRVPVFAVHSRRDQVAPIDATEKRVAELKQAGTKAELVALDAPTHYEVSAHADGLRRAIPWLRQLWK